MPSEFKGGPRIKDPELLKRFRLERFGEPCERCEKRIGVHPHHKRFRSQGGDDIPENLIWLCHVCHSEAHGIRAIG